MDLIGKLLDGRDDGPIDKYNQEIFQRLSKEISNREVPESSLKPTERKNQIDAHHAKQKLILKYVASVIENMIANLSLQQTSNEVYLLRPSWWDDLERSSMIEDNNSKFYYIEFPILQVRTFINYPIFNLLFVAYTRRINYSRYNGKHHAHILDDLPENGIWALKIHLDKEDPRYHIIAQLLEVSKEKLKKYGVRFIEDY